MRLPDLQEIIELHEKIIAQSGGARGIRDRGALESATTQPRMTFGERDLYPDLAEKAAALGHSLIANHPFIDGNKRIGHAAMEITLLLNGYEIGADVDEQERIILAVAAGKLSRAEFTAWLTRRLVLIGVRKR
uniref:Death on curing protein n=1 Tax=Candidatus Kentrum sp. FM TaxID=2126340 RepID=A0A450W490_9GAMM|nr:MAG: death on curing protein [Candidatus Kentron sp. FM]VFJ58025.1 MAG: death on curing protein [Candidatus Kentron sp. FM]VFK11829.1 MAG: death on curing protein [Candidatus Kentron sp. FM]